MVLTTEYENKLKPAIINTEEGVEDRGKFKVVTMFPEAQEQGLLNRNIIPNHLGTMWLYCTAYPRVFKHKCKLTEL